MEGTQNTTSLYKFPMDTNCSQHPYTQNQSSDALQVTTREGDVYIISNSVLKDDQIIDNTHEKKMEERQLAIADAKCMLCKTSTAEIVKVHKSSVLTKSLSICNTGTRIVAVIASLATILAFIPAICSTAMMYSLVVAVIFVVVAICFGLIAVGFTELEHQNNSHHSSCLRTNLLVNTMLNFIKKLSEQNKYLKVLLSNASLTEQEIKNITDETAKLIDRVDKEVENLYKQTNLLNETKKIANANCYLNTSTDKENKRIQIKKINEFKQKKLDAKIKLEFAVRNLLCLLTDNIFNNFTVDEDIQDKIKLSFFKSCNDNQDDFKAALTNIANACLNMRNTPDASGIELEIKTIVEVSVNKITAGLQKSSTDINANLEEIQEADLKATVMSALKDFIPDLVEN
jgi:hypothetical protein